MNQQVPYSNQNYQQDYYQAFQKPEKKGLNGLEITIICIVICVNLFSFVRAFSQNNVIVRDQNRENDIQQIILALEQFYQNSGSSETERAYPVAVCSNQSNEVDFESTLKLHLTGQRPDLDPHAYIKPEDFPRDERGVYSKTLEDRKLDFSCDKVLPLNSDQIYEDGTESCNFDRENSRYRNCYLYGSSTNGDTFTLTYYSETQDVFIRYEKFRAEPLKVETVDP